MVVLIQIIKLDYHLPIFYYQQHNLNNKLNLNHKIQDNKN